MPSGPTAVSLPSVRMSKVRCALAATPITFWLVAPAFWPGQLRLHWLDIVAPIAVGGLWLAALLWQLQRRSLLPWEELRLQEVLQHG